MQALVGTAARFGSSRESEFALAGEERMSQGGPTSRYSQYVVTTSATSHDSHARAERYESCTLVARPRLCCVRRGAVAGAPRNGGERSLDLSPWQVHDGACGAVCAV